MSLFGARRLRARPRCRRGSPARFRRGNRLAQLVAAHAGGSGWKGRSRRLLDVHLHQLAPHAGLCSRLVREVRDQGLVVVGVHTPEFPFERRSTMFARLRRTCGSSTRRSRQRLRDLERLWEQLLAGRLPRRCRRSDCFHQFGEGGYEDGERVIQHLLRVPEAMASSKSSSPSQRRAWRREPTGRTGLSRDLPRLPAGAELRFSRRCRVRGASQLRRPPVVGAQPVGPLR